MSGSAYAHTRSHVYPNTHVYPDTHAHTHSYTQPYPHSDTDGNAHSHTYTYAGAVRAGRCDTTTREQPRSGSGLRESVRDQGHACGQREIELVGGYPDAPVGRSKSEQRRTSDQA